MGGSLPSDLGTGIEYDDEAAYIRARAAMAPQGRSITDLFLRNREEILARYGEMLFPAADRKERRKRLKAVTSGFEMDSGLDAWRQKWGDGAARSSLRGATITLQGWKDKHGEQTGASDAGSSFSLEEYHTTIAHSTQHLINGARRMLDFVRNRAVGKNSKAADKQWERATRTVKSYILQEAEAASRMRKIWWCEANGVQVMGLQHDGILAGEHADLTVDEVSELMMIETAKCGYEVRIVGEWVGGARGEGNDISEDGYAILIVD